jgi:hypothetical protein
MLAASPKMSSASTITSPTWMPTRTGNVAASSRWMAIPARTASSELGKVLSVP